MKTLTKQNREPCFTEYLIEDDATGERSVMREHSDLEDVETSNEVEHG